MKTQKTCFAENVWSGSEVQPPGSRAHQLLRHGMDPRVRFLFKSLVYMGKDYPAQSGGYAAFIVRAKTAFRKTPVQSETDLEQALAKGSYIVKGM